MGTKTTLYEPKSKLDSDLFLKVMGIVHIESEKHPNWSFPLHAHEDNLELSLVLDGQGTVYYAGKIYRVRKGDLIVKHAAILHSEETLREDPIDQICLIFAGVRNDGSLFASLLPSDTQPILKTGSFFPYLEQLFLYIMEIREKKPVGYESALHDTLKALLSSVQLLGPQSDTDSKNSAAASIIHDVIHYIDTHYAENITLEDLSGLFFFSPCYLSRKFKEETGYTVNQYIISLRMGEAEKMLIFETASIKDIAQKTGYSNLQYFYTTFKKYTGYTPAEFKRLYLGIA